jgi:hypothetical protein
MGEEVKAGGFLGGVRKFGGGQVEEAVDMKPSPSALPGDSDAAAWKSDPRPKPLQSSEDEKYWAKWSAEMQHTAWMIRRTLYVAWFVAILFAIFWSLQVAGFSVGLLLSRR